MAWELELEKISEDNTTSKIAVLAGDKRVAIGREPSNGGIVIDNQAVSRHHGEFFRIRNHWFYKDCESTNGSWLNSVPVQPFRFKILRSGDILQIANEAIKININVPASVVNVGATHAPISKRSILVFNRETEGFIDEFPVPEYGRVLVIGGAKPDLEIEGELSELPALVVERRGSDLCAFSVAKQREFYFNGERKNETVILKDQDIVEIDKYLLLYNDPLSASIEQQQNLQNVLNRPWHEGEGPDLGHQPADTPLGSNIPKKTVSPVFGRVVPEHQTGMFTTSSESPPTVLSSPDIHPAMRHLVGEQQQRKSTPEDKLILIITALLALLVIAFLAWLFI
ncbi:MAG: FHA domain-containing protein [Candidatus Dadabacteria bacterium]|nr:MAG: FHA domain-containing protein [Candidatus Dadabacteria bacterium]